MQAMTGAHSRPCLAHAPQTSPQFFLRSHVLRKTTRCYFKPLNSAGGAGPGPSSISSGNDVNDGLKPIIFRFGDSSSSPSVGSITSSSSGSWTGVISSAGASTTPSHAPATTSALSAPSPTAGLAPVDAPTRPTSTPSTSWSPSSPDSTEASSHLAPNGDLSHRSYSDYYRTTNTTFQRSHSPANTHSIPTSTSTPSPPHSINHNPNLPDYSSTSSTPSSTSSTSFEPNPPSLSPSEEPAEVAAALARAQAALQRAETSLDDIQRLSSHLDDAALRSLREAATPPSRWTRVLAIARATAGVAALALGLLASHAFGLAVQWVGAVAGAAAIAGWGLRHGSLAPSGAAAAFLVGCGTLGASLRFGATLLAFFLSSSKLTAYKEELKEGLEEGARKGGQRSWIQVLCNGLVPTILAIAYGILAGCVDLPLGPPTPATALAAAATAAPLEPWRAAALTGLMGGFLGYYACCCGDTWASELGPLSADTPVLITTMRPVRRGTNGGVTLLGLSASIMGGMFVGLVFYLGGLLSPTLWIFEAQRSLAAAQWRLIPLGLMAGLLGSALDSLLGATLQYSGYDTATGRIVSAPGPGVVHIAGRRLLDNNAVNALSASLTAALTAIMALKTFGF